MKWNISEALRQGEPGYKGYYPGGLSSWLPGVKVQAGFGGDWKVWSSRSLAVLRFRTQGLSTKDTSEGESKSTKTENLKEMFLKITVNPCVGPLTET